MIRYTIFFCLIIMFCPCHAMDDPMPRLKQYDHVLSSIPENCWPLLGVVRKKSGRVSVLDVEGRAHAVKQKAERYYDRFSSCAAKAESRFEE